MSYSWVPTSIFTLWPKTGWTFLDKPLQKTMLRWLPSKGFDIGKVPSAVSCSMEGSLNTLNSFHPGNLSIAPPSWPLSVSPSHATTMISSRPYAPISVIHKESPTQTKQSTLQWSNIRIKHPKLPKRHFPINQPALPSSSLFIRRYCRI